MKALNMVVCIKPVPDPEKWHEITLDSRTKTIYRENMPHIINPLDRHALEKALQLRDIAGGFVTVITMAPPAAEENLREALALRADKAVLITGKDFAGADTLATSYAISKAIQENVDMPDIILCGAHSIDGSTAQVGPQLATHLGLIHITSIHNIEILDNTRFKVKMQLEEGYIEYAASPPFVLTISRGNNTPGSPTLMGIMEAENKEIQTLTLDDLKIDKNKVGINGSPTQIAEVFAPGTNRKCEMLEGNTEELAEQLVKKLSGEGVIY